MSLRKQLQSLYWRMEAAFGVRFPRHPYEEVIGAVIGPSTRWLDVGCGHRAIDSWRGEQETALVRRAAACVGVDPDVPSLRHHRSFTRLVAGTLSRLPFPDASFDLVTANMVVEHLDAPEEQFREVARVLAAGGQFVFVTPNRSGYTVRLVRLVPEAWRPRLALWLHGRQPEDVFPTHYRANTGPDVRALAVAARLEVLEIRYLLSWAFFGMVPPLAALELALMRLLMRPSLATWRPRMLAVLAKPREAPAAAAGA